MTIYDATLLNDFRRCRADRVRTAMIPENLGGVRL